MLHIGLHVEFIVVLPALPPEHGLLAWHPGSLGYLKAICLWGGDDQPVETGDLRRRTRSRAGGGQRSPPVSCNDGNVRMHFS